MKVQGSEAIIKCLIQEGVDTIYGYPGGAIMPVYDSLYNYQVIVICNFIHYWGEE